MLKEKPISCISYLKYENRPCQNIKIKYNPSFLNLDFTNIYKKLNKTKK